VAANDVYDYEENHSTAGILQFLLTTALDKHKKPLFLGTPTSHKLLRQATSRNKIWRILLLFLPPGTTGDGH